MGAMCCALRSCDHHLVQLHPEMAELTTRLSLFELVKKNRKCLSKKRSEGARHEGGLIRCFKFVGFGCF